MQSLGTPEPHAKQVPKSIHWKLRILAYSYVTYTVRHNAVEYVRDFTLLMFFFEMQIHSMYVTYPLILMALQKGTFPKPENIQLLFIKLADF